MHRFFITVLFCICCLSTVESQNLIRNGSFEEYVCKGSEENFRFVFPYWTMWGSLSSPYIESDCQHLYYDEESIIDVNDYGIPNPLDGSFYINGIHYLGYSSVRDTFYFDDLQFYAKLEQPLLPQKTYRISFGLALNPIGGLTTDNIKVALFKDTSFYFPVNWKEFDDKIPIYRSPKGQYVDSYEEWTIYTDCFEVRPNNHRFLGWFIDLPHGKNSYKEIPFDSIPKPSSFNTAHHLNSLVIWIDDVIIEEISTAERSFSVSYCDDRPTWTLDTAQVPALDIFELPAEYSWADGTEGLYRSFDAAGSYRLRVETNCGTVPVEVEVRERSCREKFYIPNVFSPNNDGINDHFDVYSENITYKRLQIYNRAGQKVFESRHPEHRWDGTFEGQKLPEGVYVYLFEYLDYEGARRASEGSVTLLR